MSKYKFYASLLDAFKWYQASESEDAEQEFIDKINRVPITDAKALERMNKGTAYNNAIDKALSDKKLYSDDVIEVMGFYFDAKPINALIEQLSGCVTQLFCETTLGEFTIYGYLDFLLYDKVIDLKVSSSYDLGKYNGGIQKHLYPLCLVDKGSEISAFEYWISVNDTLYKEPYIFDYEQSKNELLRVCNELKYFIEQKRHLITDTKIFS